MKERYQATLTTPANGKLCLYVNLHASHSGLLQNYLKLKALEMLTWGHI